MTMKLRSISLKITKTVADYGSISIAWMPKNESQYNIIAWPSYEDFEQLFKTQRKDSRINLTQISKKVGKSCKLWWITYKDKNSLAFIN